jgi:hypothetical protein
MTLATASQMRQAGPVPGLARTGRLAPMPNQPCGLPLRGC